MAATLKLGDRKWATKEGSLLAYNDENNNYKPLPFDFTRASSATRVNKQGLIETVASGVPRIDYTDANGALKLEPQRTNLVTYSNDFSNAYWTKTRCTINQNSIISPSGLLNASLLTATDTSENYIQSNVSTAVSGTKQVISCFVKKGTSDFTHLLLWDTSANGARQWFDLENGIIGTSTSFGSGISVDSASIEEYVNGWYRCIVVFNNSITPVRFRISASNGDGDFNSSIGKTIYIWGYQLEQGSYATSYIPTQGSAVTVVKDVCSGAGNDQVFNSEEGVLYFEGSALVNDSDTKRICISDGSSSNRVVLTFANNTITYAYISGGISANIIYNSDTTINKKYACTWKLNEFKFWANGVQVGIDTSGGVMPLNTLDKFDLTDATGYSPFYGNVKDIQVFTTALTDAELIALTT
jgi:hypothetical protein